MLMTLATETSRVRQGRDMDLLPPRNYNTTLGRFINFDTFEGHTDEPITLNHYIYAGADPVNHTDPGGHDFSLGEAITVGAISGGVLGGISGVAYSTVYKQASFFSWETAQDALIGATGGAIVGAFLGGGIYVLGGGSASQILPTLQSGLGSFLRKWGIGQGGGIGTWVHKKTLGATAVGFASGVMVGWNDPSLIVGVGSAIATATTALTDISLRGVIYRQDILFPNMSVPSFSHSALGYINRYVLAGTFLGIGFGVGFTAGYTVGASARGIYDQVH